MVFVANNDHIDEENHHRDTPDHCHRSLENIINNGREIAWFETCTESVGCNNESQGGKECRNDTLYQHSYPRDPIGIHFAHHGWHTAVETRDEEEATEGVVVDSSVEDEEANKDEVDEPTEDGSSGTKGELYSFGYS